MPDMLIPFIMLLILTIALILERKFQEDKIVEIYEEKFENWKKNSSKQQSEEEYKELVGLVFKEKDQLNIELLNPDVKDRLNRNHFKVI
jgi:hypothetical protein